MRPLLLDSLTSLESGLLLRTQQQDLQAGEDDEIHVAPAELSLTVSVVSVWEIVLKHHAGRLRLPAGLHQVVDQILYGSPWTILPVAPEHLPALAALPAIPTQIPSIRLLIALSRPTARRHGDPHCRRAI